MANAPFEDPELRAQVEEILGDFDPNIHGLRYRILDELGIPVNSFKRKLVFRYVDELQNVMSAEGEPPEELPDLEGLQAEDCECKRHVYRLKPILANLIGHDKIPFHKVEEKIRKMIREERQPDPNDCRYALLSNRLATVLGTRRIKKSNLWPILKKLMTPEGGCPCCTNN